MIVFKTFDVSNEFFSEKLDPRVRALVAIVDGWFQYHGKGNCKVTDVYRPDPKSPHSDWRACDIDTDPQLTDGEAMNLRDWINCGFGYDPTRPGIKTAKYEKAGQRNPNGSVATGTHLHIQVWVKNG